MQCVQNCAEEGKGYYDPAARSCGAGCAAVYSLDHLARPVCADACAHKMFEEDASGQKQCVDACAGVLLAAAAPADHLRCAAACPAAEPFYIAAERSCKSACDGFYDPGAQQCVAACGGDFPYTPGADMSGADAQRCTQCLSGFLLYENGASRGNQSNQTVFCYNKCPAQYVSVDGVCTV